NNEIYSAPFNLLNDIFEARFTINENHFALSQMRSVIKEQDLKKINASTLKVLREYADNVNEFGIYSLSKTFEDELLWAYYADSHRGFCLEYELDELMEYRMRDELVIPVDYQEKMPCITDIDLLDFFESKKMAGNLNRKMIGTKSLRWKHEDEVRIVTGQSGLYKYKPSSLKSIYFGCRCDSRFIKLVMKVLCGRGLKYYKMSMKADTYKLERNRLEDCYKGRSYNNKVLATVENGVPYIFEGNEKYVKYINVAIDIVRRLPDCKNIFNADLSVNKGTPSNPVVYVQYESIDGRIQSEYYTLNVLDYYFRKQSKSE
ncbi:DUF2971 domain-containing protein, partial [Salmonella enterica]|nr:DUF2971 domain-containing protein [Salmonella enterica subsp. enterica serovar Montevideo]EBA9040929.1 DUF2971 domain-containing protein [Salmonella enterica]EHJ5313703.1 DUF2971 domain-containing protein [Salmonella enterica subsp. enterica serovar Oranienburg]EID2789239.1 DUF2971 domain-containing protein [Salmonella enterica]EJQ3410593.1 DUF2971 domain-containing protein [Salmonella enterica]